MILVPIEVEKLMDEGEVIDHRLLLPKNEIFTSVELCKRLLEQTGVAILPGCDFGRQPEELTARIAYVDFNGEEAIKTSQNMPSDVEMNQDFIHSYCPNLVRAANIIAEWIKNL